MAANFNYPNGSMFRKHVPLMIRDNINAVGKMNYTGASNIPNGAVRYNRSNKKIEVYNSATTTWSSSPGNFQNASVISYPTTNNGVGNKGYNLKRYVSLIERKSFSGNVNCEFDIDDNSGKSFYQLIIRARPTYPLSGVTDQAYKDSYGNGAVLPWVYGANITSIQGYSSIFRSNYSVTRDGGAFTGISTFSSSQERNYLPGQPISIDGITYLPGFAVIDIAIVDNDPTKAMIISKIYSAKDIYMPSSLTSFPRRSQISGNFFNLSHPITKIGLTASSNNSIIAGHAALYKYCG